jgi:predicted dehydrogenase
MKKVKVGIIGGGLMGREAASAFGRWFVLNDYPVSPELTAVCDVNPDVLNWYKRIPTVSYLTDSYEDLLKQKELDVIYVAVPHHLHEKIYIDVLNSGKDLLAEKPFGINYKAAESIVKAIDKTKRFVRCSSEFPFYPGPQRLIREITEGNLGQILEIKAGFLHSSDLDPNKPINWKRRTETCGEIGVMGDLGMHVLHIPLRMGWKPETIYAQLQKIYSERPDGKGNMVECDTWDNARLISHIKINKVDVPMTFEMKRIAPGETNTWYIEVVGTKRGIKYSTKEPKTLWIFENEKEQSWKKIDMGFQTQLPTITGHIFETGFPDCFMQMLAAYFLEREGLLKGFGCVKPEEALESQKIFNAALQSHKSNQVIQLNNKKA